MKTKVNVFQVIVWGLCAVIAIALAIIVFTDRKKNQERVLEAKLQSQLQENTHDDKELEKELNYYADFVSNLQSPEFVCWGDNEMAEHNNNSLAIAFEETMNDNLLKMLVDSFGDFIKQGKTNAPSISVSNMGASNEGMSEILVRAGVNGIEVGEWAVIPGDKTPTNLVLRNNTLGSTLHFSNQKTSKLGKVVISDTEGAFVNGDKNYDEDHPIYAFVREREGDSFQVGLGTEIEIESATKYIGNVPIFYFGDKSVNTVESVDEFVEGLESLVQRYTVIKEEVEEASEELPYVVICTVDEGSELDESLKDVFGNHYIRNDTYADEMTEEGYKELAQKAYANLDGQGCFDKMKDMIEKASEELKAS